MLYRFTNYVRFEKINGRRMCTKQKEFLDMGSFFWKYVVTLDL